MRKELEESLELLSKNWDINPVIRDFILENRTDVSDFVIKVKDVVFHIPYLTKEESYILWKCYWQDCNKCCDSQGR